MIPALAGLLSGFFQGFTWLVSYITNNVFPCPWEKGGAKLLLRMEQGDQEARNVLIERNLEQAHIVKKFDNTGKIMTI